MAPDDVGGTAPEDAVEHQSWTFTKGVPRKAADADFVSIVAGLRVF